MPFSKESALDRLRDARESGRLAHAYLITGPVGSGKSWLADHLAALCLDSEPAKVRSHPDLHIVQPESKSRRIVIDQIRNLDQAVQRKPLVASGKAIIIHDADRMQPQAANAFLKTLEEPPAGSLILLLSTLPEAILETVLSRCVETPLMGEKSISSSQEETAILKALSEALLSPGAGAGEAFRFTRAVQALLTEARERISEEYESSLKAEAAHYKQASEGGSWLQERTEQVKAMTEASALRERERILHLIVDILGRALRTHHGQPSDNATIRALSEKFPPKNLLRRLDAMETLRRRLAMGVQESLSLESGFLEMITVQ